MTEQINPSTHRKFTRSADPGRALASEHEEARPSALEVFSNALTELQEAISVDDLPPDHHDKEGFLRHLRRIHVAPEPSGGFYDLDLLEGRIELGAAMLETMRTLDEAALRRFSEALLLHETLHLDQGLYTSNHHGISHASVVLEEMDYRADAFSLSTAIAFHCRNDSEKRRPVDIAKDYVRMGVQGMEVFDRTEQGERLNVLGEARLRRYLIWYLQGVRVATVETVDDVFGLLMPRLAVEIEPLAGELDENHEKLIGEATSDAQFFLSLEGRLVRHSSEPPSFHVPDLLEGIRTYDAQKVHDALRFIVDVHHDVLAGQL